MSEKYIRGYKFKIYPTEEQKEKLNRYIELHRAIYNWAIEQEQKICKLHKNGESEYGFYNFRELCALFTAEKRKPESEWMKELPDHTARTALRNVTNGYKRFFKGQNFNKPWFKDKKTCKKAFGTRNNRFKIHNDGIKIEGMQDSYIKLGFKSGMYYNKVINPVITLDNLGDYYISFSVEEDIVPLDTPKTDVIGIDLGTRQTIILSTGEAFNQPNEKLKKLDRRIRRLEKHIARDRNRRYEIARRTRTKYEDIPKSKRELKREFKKNKLLRKQHNIKDTFYHTIIKREVIDRNPECVIMENISVTEMHRTGPYLSSQIAQVSFYDIICKTRDKCNKHNIPFIQAPRDFKSTKTCSNCGYEKDLKGYHRYICPNCGMKMDRDINAAINLKNYGLEILNS